MKFPVRLLLAVFFCLVTFLCLRSISFAQTQSETYPQQNTSELTTNTSPDVPKNLHNWTQTVLIETIAAISCEVTGMDPTNPNQKCLGVDPKTNKIGFVENGGGVIGMLSSNLSLLYTPPLHTGDYLSYLSKNFGLAKHSYAAGTTGLGFAGLEPLITVWVGFRNIAYLFFILVFLVIGVAVMLRVKIDPRTVMTIQNQIPKIIIGIVMVTFSFAIAGLLIDAMWESMYVSFGLMQGVAKNITGELDYINKLSPANMYGQNPLDLYGGWAGQIVPDTGGDVNGASSIPSVMAPRLKTVMEDTLGITHCDAWSGGCLLGGFLDVTKLAPNIATGNVADSVIEILSWVAALKGFNFGFNAAIWCCMDPEAVGNGPGTVLGWIAGLAAGGVSAALFKGVAEFVLREFLPWLIIFLIIYVAVLTTLLRLWFELIKSYIFVLFDVILAPLWIIAGLIPGNTGINFSSWLKDLASNLAAFPAVAFMFWIGSILMGAIPSTAGSGGGSMFIPPLIGNPDDPTFLQAIIGLGVILTTPAVVAMVKKAFKAPSVGLGGAAAQAISSGVAVPMAGVKTGIAYFAKTPNMGQKGGIWGALRSRGVA